MANLLRDVIHHRNMKPLYFVESTMAMSFAAMSWVWANASRGVYVYFQLSGVTY